ncbi:DUF455-domain-containing protein [Neolentinus lepideus HHB14362 ss-1]|uniref:DUF455-domain-containing protein n=1 Tax=Neolentinus lepideus HHB14362 ss-1 TaxID=1314782 RepID=A0A165VRG3_9AGAM|nr:DUF455-domain-containing protein [Neolentinus lepideus HHB14362 ss-1]
MDLLQVAPYNNLLTHTRYLLTLRSEQGKYHSLILFRLSGSSDAALHEKYAESSSTPGPQYSQLYAMESTCPHLGLDMSHAEIEDCEDSVIAVCPWHSETGLKACTYNVQIRPDEDAGLEKVWVQMPEGGTNWRLVELRPVSEEFADPPSTTSTVQTGKISELTVRDEDVVPPENPPKTLIQWAVLILNTADPTLKVQRTRHAVHLFRKGQLSSIGQRGSSVPQPPDLPPRDEAYVKNSVDPGKIGRRKNRAVMLHALANIEQWAWDIIARFGPLHPDLPPAFYSDFAKVALDESKHFSLLCSRLSDISPETPYGSMPVHASLWDSAQVTFSSLRARLAIIHLVQEARGLDVNPATIEKFRRQGDVDSVKVLEVIHTDEVTHVTAGHRWFTWLCAKQGVDPVKAFREDVRRCWTGDVKGPFNASDREKAGMTKEFYEDLKGERKWEGNTLKYGVQSKEEKAEKSSAAVNVEYEK